MRTMRLFVGLMLMITAFSPFLAINEGNDGEFSVGLQDFEEFANNGVLVFDEKGNMKEERVVFNTGGRAPTSCPATPALQNDGGTAGDAGNASTNTDKDIGSDPSTTFDGCASSATDVEDWYRFTMSNGSNIDVALDGYDSSNDYDLYLLIEDNGSYYYVDYSWYDDPVETVSSMGTSIEGVAGTYWIAVIPYGGGGTTSQGDYTVQTWTNYTESCSDWYSPQNDGGTGADAPSNWSESPPNMGNNVTDAYTGCLDKDDLNDVFTFSVPVNHTIEAQLSMDSGVDFDVVLHQPNGSEIDSSLQSNNATEDVSSLNTEADGLAGDYFVNLSRWSGNGNYTLYVWTNYSVPTPNLVVTDVSIPGNTNPGDSVILDVTVENDGTADLAETYSIDLYMSVDSNNDWYDYHLGNSNSSNNLAINASQTVSINAEIPTGIVEGEYLLIVILDESEQVEEKNEEDNEFVNEERLVVGSVSPGCNVQDDGGSGGDAPEDSSSGTPIDLGMDIVQEFRGCVDSSDTEDLYKISITANMPLNITLVSAPAEDAYFYMALYASNGTLITYDINSGDSFLNLEDLDDYEGVAGDYYVNVSYFEGLGGAPGGIYRLIIGEPAGNTFVPSFNCDDYSDMETGGDASDSSTTATNLGTNVTITGTGCLDKVDTSDWYLFDLAEGTNINISVMQTESTDFTIALQYSNGGQWNLITMEEDTSGIAPIKYWTSVDNSVHEGKNYQYRITISSPGDVGNYTLNITTLAPALPDLEATIASCGPDAGTSIETDNGKVVEIAYSFKISNNGGPGGVYSWSFVFVNSNDLTEFSIANGTTEQIFNQDVLKQEADIYDIGFTKYDPESSIPSGDYYCQLRIDLDNLVEEENEDNNILNGTTFSVDNIAEKWVGDEDRDGFNDTIDNCPYYGTSIHDRMGCPDDDGDGWSNGWEIEQDEKNNLLDLDGMKLDPTQWNDTDGDGFGDNMTGVNGDQCPLNPAPESEDGCPPDSDGDGIFDEDDLLCPETPPNTEVSTPLSPIGGLTEMIGCSENEIAALVAEQTNPCDDDPNGPACELHCESNPEQCESETNSNAENETGPNDNSPDNPGTNEENEALNNNLLSTSDGSDIPWNIIGIIAGIVIVLLVTLLVLKGGSKENMGGFDSGFGGEPMGMGTGDITPEQHAYEQQLIAGGYPPEYARQYADQHFRPWLNS